MSYNGQNECAVRSEVPDVIVAKKDRDEAADQTRHQRRGAFGLHVTHQAADDEENAVDVEKDHRRSERGHRSNLPEVVLPTQDAGPGMREEGDGRCLRGFVLAGFTEIPFAIRWFPYARYRREPWNQNRRPLLFPKIFHPLWRKSLRLFLPERTAMHRSWGFGQVKDWDAPNETVVLDFKTKKGHLMQFIYAAESLTPLPKGHVAVQKAESLEAVRQESAEPIPSRSCRTVFAAWVLQATADNMSKRC